MFKRLTFAFLLLALAGCSPSTAAPAPTAAPTNAPSIPEPASTEAGTSLTEEVEMMLHFTSPAFEPGGSIPARFTCVGEDLSPALEWGEPPAGTRSFALIMDDPDAPNGVFVHWVIYNIPAESRGLPEAVMGGAELPDGTRQGLNSAHENGYLGPCPPSGTHRYFFKLYALDTMLEDLGSEAGASELMKAISGRFLVNAELMGTFHK